MSDGESMLWMLAATCVAIVGIVVAVLVTPTRAAPNYAPACTCAGADGGAP